MKIRTNDLCKKIVSRLAVLVALAAVAVPAVAQDGYGKLTGTIKVTGDVPKPEKVDVNKDQAVCLADGHEVFVQTLQVNDESKLQGAFVMLYPKTKIKVHPDLKAVPEEPVVLDNNECIFVPTNLAIRQGQKLILKNSDAAGHNCNVQSFNISKNVNLPQNSETEVAFDKEDKLPAVVKCDIHPWMMGYLLVRDDPYFAVTGEDGSFTIDKIPAGKWKFQFWHNRCGYMKDLEKDGETFLGRRGEFTVEIKDGETVDLGELLIDAASLKEKS